jgi:porin
MTPHRRWGAGLTLGAALCAAGTASAAPAEIGVEYTFDVIGPVSGVSPRVGRTLDNLKVDGDFDLEALAGWRGGKAHLTVLGSFGETPNEDVGTLQGVDNIEVSNHSLRLFEAWVEQAVGARATLRAGLYDLNSEFYSNESAGLLVAPAFGIGSELAATGPNGPSIFPSTALAVRARFEPSSETYFEAAALNARAGVLGDPDGVDLSFDDGALVIAEGGWNGPVKLGLGAWSYTHRQDDIRDVDAGGLPVQRRAAGAYVLVEHQFWAAADEVQKLTGFLRAGVADGDTTPYRGGWQAGFLLEAPIRSRPHSQVSFGVDQAFLTDKFRANERDAGTLAASAETQFELTYADTIGDHLTLQPDLQYVIHPGGDAARKDAVVAGLRLRLSF